MNYFSLITTWLIAIWLIFFLSPASVLSQSSGPPINPLVNRCPEGKFLSIKDGKCFELMTNYGFNWSQFPSYASLKRVTARSASEIKNFAASGDLYIKIPADTYTVSEIRPGSNVVIEGEGHDKTVIQCNHRYGFEIIGNSSNVVVRNLRIIGDPNNCWMGVFFNGSGSNVLVEGVMTENTQNKGIGGYQDGRQLTVRYNWVNGTRDWHGIGVDDRYESVAFYSNYITNVGFNDNTADAYAIDSHAIKTEIAGNYSENTRSMVKLPDGVDILVHRNYFGKALVLNRYVWTYKDQKRCPQNHVYFDNEIHLSGGDPPFKFYDSTNMYIADNSFFGDYTAEVGGRSRICTRGPVYACPGTQDASLSGVEIASEDVFVDFAGVGKIYPCRLGQGTQTSPTPIPIPSPGDGNNDGFVNGQDFIIWLTHFGQSVSGANNGDYDGNEKVEIGDYVIWIKNFAT